MRPRTEIVLGRDAVAPALAAVPTVISEEESRPLACASAQGRRRAARVQSDAIHHKVGCSWSATAGGAILDGSAGPTTPPRFEPSRIAPPAVQTGEPTVSHEGGNGIDSSSTFSKQFKTAVTGG